MRYTILSILNYGFQDSRASTDFSVSKVFRATKASRITSRKLRAFRTHRVLKILRASMQADISVMSNL